jgi:hypothetical protein
MQVAKFGGVWEEKKEVAKEFVRWSRQKDLCACGVSVILQEKGENGKKRGVI